jgi:hypothetical protein
LIIKEFREIGTLFSFPSEQILVIYFCILNDGAALLVVCEIPDAFSKNGIYHRSDFILSAPN